MVRVSIWLTFLICTLVPVAGAQVIRPAAAYEELSGGIPDAGDMGAGLVAQDPLLSAPAASEYQAFLNGVRGAKGASWFVLALVGAQALFLLLRSVCGEILGIYRLLVLAILSVLATIASNILGGKSVVQSVLLDAGTLMAYQVLFHQVKRQWEKRNEDRVRIALERNANELRVEESANRFPGRTSRFKFFRRRDHR